MVYYNSYLPLLVDATQTVRDAKTSGSVEHYHATRDKVGAKHSRNGKLRIEDAKMRTVFIKDCYYK